ncbi:MAG: phytanoyl-CoA dioxygenase [Acidimicrobiales bacterium]|nr:phytanoyl-CoA dioxygenase [Acidimicrobiales bacterium]
MPSAEATDAALVADLVAQIEADGYAIVEDAISAEVADGLAADIARIEAHLGIEPGDNSFEGEATTRVYNLLSYGGPWLDVPLHPVVLPVAEAVLGGQILVSTISSIAIGPGETAQPIHADDQVMPLTRPHVPTVCNSMWALTDFTEANGATRIVPGSHKLDHAPGYGRHYDSIAAEMAKGSILIWTGSLWHGGGANTTDHTRLGVAMNYCAGWVRQQENQQLGIPPETMAGFSPRLRELCGLGVYRGLIGHIDKQTPAQRLYGDRPPGHHLFDKS